MHHKNAESVVKTQSARNINAFIQENGFSNVVLEFGSLLAQGRHTELVIKMAENGYEYKRLTESLPNP